MRLVALVAAFIASGLAHADERDAIVIDVPLDATVTGAALTVWLGPELLKGHLAPAACRWCSTNGFDSGARSTLRWSDHQGAAVTASNLAAYAVAPVVGLGLTALTAAHDGRRGEIWVDALLMVEAVAIAGDLNQLVKLTAGRQRPFAHAGLPNPDPSQNRSDDNLSFFSGHTSFTFSLAAAGGTIATLRGYRWAPAVWIFGAVVAATTGYLRIAADEHYATDVLTGALVGTGIGVATPTLHRSRPEDAPRRPSVAIVPTTGGGSLLYGGVW